MRKGIFLIFIIVSALFGCQQDPVETPVESIPTEPIPSEPTPDPIEVVFQASRQMNNYTMTMDIYHQSDVHTTIFKVTDLASSVEIDLMVDYYQKDDGTCIHLYPTTHGYVREIIECKPESATVFGFIEAFQKSWFTAIGDTYYLNIQNYDVIQSFFERYMPGFVVSNVELTLGTTHFHRLKLDLQSETLLYRLDIIFSDIGQTTVHVPQEG